MRKSSVSTKRKPRNKFEISLDKDLAQSKIKYKYESERIAYVRAGHYRPDFVLESSRGKIYIEAKGYFRPEHKSILRAVKICNPSLDIRLVFYSYKLENIRWAERHGFPYAISKIPKEWYDELR